MKALKEKRVSLRSLFRRSLVILSLLALAFAVASCGGDSESDNPGGSGDSGNSGDSSGPMELRKTVADMKVIDHPSKPSYEGAYPDLTGLKVLVTWTDGTSDPVTDTSMFTVYPPVAYITGSEGSHEALSPEGRYAIQYIGPDNDYYSHTYRRNVYIPAVIAMDIGAGVDTAGTTAKTKLSGNFGEVYEDEGVTKGSAGLFINSVYATFNTGSFAGSFASSVVTPIDSGYGSYGTLIATWTSYETTSYMERTKPISDNPEAWRIDVRDATTGKANAVYYANLNSNDIVGKHIVELSKDIDNFYKVDKIEYAGGIESIGYFAVDGANSGTLNTPLPISGIGGTNSTATSKAWVEKLLTAGNDIKFNVYYYNKSDPKTRTFMDYYKAMYTMGDSPNIPGSKVPKASLPELIGDPDFPTPSAIESLQEGYDLSLVLYYYNPLIYGSRGEGKLQASSGTYVEANGAILPVSDQFLIYDSTRGVIKKEKTTTAHPSQNGQEEHGEPYILSDWDYQKRGEQLYLGLQKYWDVYYCYKTKKGEDKEIGPIAWPTVTFSSTDGLADNPDYGLVDGELEDAAKDLERRPCTVGFPVPFSADPDRTDAVNLGFYFWMQRR